MSKAITIMLSLLLTVTLSAQSADTSNFSALRQKLAEYYDAMKAESLSVQAAECDFLIETATDPLLRQFIAQDIYDHYVSSPLMGAENVAVHVFDRWFAEGGLEMSSPEAFADAKVYADFNRQSLVGAHAPGLSMEGIDGAVVNLFGPDSAGKYSVLYFYDVDCSKCKLETRLLNALFAAKDYPLHFYPIYVGDNRTAWQSYVSENFSASYSPDMTVIHMWDPSLESDFQRNYGVTKTPRLFLIGPDGIVLGRGLDAQALELMLDELLSEKSLEYGSRESEILFDGIFAMSSGKPSTGEVKGIADYICDRTLGNRDTLMFRQLAGDYLYYLSSHSGEGFKEGMRYHIDKNILSQGDVWTSPDDSLKVVGFARIMSDLLSKAMPGTYIQSVKVPGELYTSGDTEVVRREKNVRLDKLKGDENIIIFYTEGCEVCAAEKEAALKQISGKTKVFMVNVDSIMASDPALASRLMDTFDLSSLPYIIMTDRSGKVLRRYLSLIITT